MAAKNKKKQKERSRSNWKLLVLLAPPAVFAGIVLSTIKVESPPETNTAGDQQEATTSTDPVLRDSDLLRAERAFQNFDAQTAIERYEAARRRYPDSPEPLIGLAKTFIATRQLTNALNVTTVLLEKAPEHPEGHYLRGKVYEAMHDIDRAEHAYQRAAERAPADPRPLLQLAAIAKKRGHTEIEIQRYKEALKTDPLCIEAVHYLASGCMLAGRFNEAKQLLRNALKHHPGNQSLQLNLAHTYLTAGEADKAVDLFKKVIEKGAAQAMPHYHLACALELLKRETEAVEALQKAIERDPSLHKAWYALARIYTQEGEEKKALDALVSYKYYFTLNEEINDLIQRAQKFPRNTALLMKLGLLYMKKKTYLSALRTFYRVYELDPDYAGITGYIQNAETLYRKKQKQ